MQTNSLVALCDMYVKSSVYIQGIIKIYQNPLNDYRQRFHGSEATLPFQIAVMYISLSFTPNHKNTYRYFDNKV